MALYLQILLPICSVIQKIFFIFEKYVFSLKEPSLFILIYAIIIYPDRIVYIVSMYSDISELAIDPIQPTSLLPELKYPVNFRYCEHPKSRCRLIFQAIQNRILWHRCTGCKPHHCRNYNISTKMVCRHGFFVFIQKQDAAGTDMLIFHRTGKPTSFTRRPLCRAIEKPNPDFGFHFQHKLRASIDSDHFRV